jgi:hypothetical protein
MALAKPKAVEKRKQRQDIQKRHQNAQKTVTRSMIGHSSGQVLTWVEKPESGNSHVQLMPDNGTDHQWWCTKGQDYMVSVASKGPESGGAIFLGSFVTFGVYQIDATTTTWTGATVWKNEYLDNTDKEHKVRKCRITTYLAGCAYCLTAEKSKIYCKPKDSNSGNSQIWLIETKQDVENKQADEFKEKNKLKKRKRREFRHSDSDPDWEKSDSEDFDDSEDSDEDDDEYVRPKKRQRTQEIQESESESSTSESSETEVSESEDDDSKSIDLTTIDGEDEANQDFGLRCGPDAFYTFLCAENKENRQQTPFWKHVTDTFLATKTEFGHAQNYKRCQEMLAAEYDYKIVRLSSAINDKCFACNMFRWCVWGVQDKKSGRDLGPIGSECLDKVKELAKFMTHLDETVKKFEEKRAELDKFQDQAYKETIKFLARG